MFNKGGNRYVFLWAGWAREDEAYFEVAGGRPLVNPTNLLC